MCQRPGINFRWQFDALLVALVLVSKKSALTTCQTPAHTNCYTFCGYAVCVHAHASARILARHTASVCRDPCVRVASFKLPFCDNLDCSRQFPVVHDGCYLVTVLKPAHILCRAVSQFLLFDIDRIELWHQGEELRVRTRLLPRLETIQMSSTRFVYVDSFDCRSCVWPLISLNNAFIRHRIYSTALPLARTILHTAMVESLVSWRAPTQKTSRRS